MDIKYKIMCVYLYGILFHLAELPAYEILIMMKAFWYENFIYDQPQNRQKNTSICPVANTGIHGNQ